MSCLTITSFNIWKVVGSYRIIFTSKRGKPCEGHITTDLCRITSLFFGLGSPLTLHFRFLSFFCNKRKQGDSSEASRQTHLWGGIRSLLSFVTWIVCQAAGVRWDAAAGKSKVMLTALVKSFFCDFVRDLCEWVVCRERAKQQEGLCCHLSVRGDSGSSWLVHWRQVSVRILWTIGVIYSCLAVVKHKAKLSTLERLVAVLLGKLTSHSLSLQLGHFQWSLNYK